MSSEIQVTYFLEDIAHEKFIRALVWRVASGIPLKEDVRNATYGGRVWFELKQFLRELKADLFPIPDVLIVAIDGNCNKASWVRKQIEEEVQRAGISLPFLICAVPDPHIERWYLEDQQALSKVLPGAKTRKLKYKCERDRYKAALKEAIRSAGLEPILGGAEYGEEIALVLEPQRLDRSFKVFWKDLTYAFTRLSLLELL